MKFTSYLCLLVWLVCASTGLSFNVTESFSNDIRPTKNDEPNIEMEDTGYGNMRDETGNLRLRQRLREDISGRLGTRGIFFGRSERSIMKPYMRPRRRFGMFGPPPFYRQSSMGYGGRYPGRYSRYGPYGRYESDPYMENYEMYPQNYGGYQTYNEQPMIQNPSYYQPMRPYGQPQSSYYRPESYNQPQSAQSLYQGQPQPQRPQQQQQFANVNPYYPDQQAMESSVRPQSVPFSQYTYNSTPPQGNREQPIDSQLQRSESIPYSEYNYNSTPQPGNRVQPINSQLQRTESNPQFRTATQTAGQGDRIPPQMAATSPYRVQPTDSQLQRAGLNPQFRTATQASGRSDTVQPQIVATPNLQQPISPELQRAGSNTELRREGIPTQIETTSTPSQNRDQNNIQQPFSGLVSYLRGPSAARTETSNNGQPQPAATTTTQQTREVSEPTQVQKEVAAAA